jgi:hypothetical protein
MLSDRGLFLLEGGVSIALGWLKNVSRGRFHELRGKLAALGLPFRRQGLLGVFLLRLRLVDVGDEEIVILIPLIVQLVHYFLLVLFLPFLYPYFLVLQGQQKMLDGFIGQRGAAFFNLFQKVFDLIELSHGQFNIDLFEDPSGFSELKIVIEYEFCKVELFVLWLSRECVELQKAVASKLVVIDVLFLDATFEDESVDEIVEDVDVDHVVGYGKYFLKDCGYLRLGNPEFLQNADEHVFFNEVVEKLVFASLLQMLEDLLVVEISQGVLYQLLELLCQ